MTEKWKQQVSFFPRWTENEDKESYEKSWKKLNFIVRPAEGGSECIMHTVLKVCFCMCVSVCVTCPADEILPGPDKSQDVSISFLVSSQWNRGGWNGGRGEGPEMYE